MPYDWIPGEWPQRWHAVHAQGAQAPSSAWTLSPSPAELGWETDSGQDGYGLPRSVAERIVGALNNQRPRRATAERIKARGEEWAWLEDGIRAALPGVKLEWETSNYGLALGLAAALGQNRWGRVVLGEVDYRDPFTCERVTRYWDLNEDDHFEPVEVVRERAISDYVRRLRPWTKA